MRVSSFPHQFSLVPLSIYSYRFSALLEEILFNPWFPFFFFFFFSADITRSLPYLRSLPNFHCSLVPKLTLKKAILRHASPASLGFRFPSPQRSSIILCAEQKKDMHMVPPIESAGAALLGSMAAIASCYAGRHTGSSDQMADGQLQERGGW